MLVMMCFCVSAWVVSVSSSFSHSSQCDVMSCRTCLVLVALALTALTSAEDATGHSPELTELPDERGLPDTPGPYKEAPSDADAEKPAHAMPAWRSKVPNATQGSLGSLVSLKAWQDYQFCNVHKTGFFCDGTARIRCCKLEDGYAKCGSTANSGTCAAEKPDLSKLKSLGFYKTRQASSFCQRQLHVGTYCYKHRYVYCCNYGAGVVECQPQHQSGRWCMDVFL